MLLIPAEANAFNTSGAYNEFPKWGLRPPAPFGDGSKLLINSQGFHLCVFIMHLRLALSPICSSSGTVSLFIFLSIPLTIYDTGKLLKQVVAGGF